MWLAIYGVNNGSNQCAIKRTSSRMGYWTVECGAVVDSFGSCAKSTSAGKWVHAYMPEQREKKKTKRGKCLGHFPRTGECSCAQAVFHILPFLCDAIKRKQPPWRKKHSKSLANYSNLLKLHKTISNNFHDYEFCTACTAHYSMGH